jgi:large subunit ribosomal protein L6
MNPLASTSMLRTAVATASRTTSRRCISSTTIRRSHIGSAPLTIPAGVTLDLPTHSTPTSSSTSTNSPLRTISITGPLGNQILPIAHPVILHPPTPENPNQLSVTVENPDVKAQKALWGLTRALLGNAVVGVSEGYRLVLRLVGVGYRASVEPIPPTLRRLLLQPRSPTHTPLTSDEAPVDRLNMKLGYAHPIYVDIPKGITVSTPQPTRIVLQGTDKQKLGLFAAKVRRWRKPEPYRGKVSTSRGRGGAKPGVREVCIWLRLLFFLFLPFHARRVSLWEKRRSRSKISRKSRRQGDTSSLVRPWDIHPTPSGTLFLHHPPFKHRTTTSLGTQLLDTHPNSRSEISVHLGDTTKGKKQMGFLSSSSALRV